MLTDGQRLTSLRMHWGGYYVISLADGVWRAARVSNSAIVLTADSARELRDRMKDDYAGQAGTRQPGEGGSL
jgi:hypothetical protein